MKTRVKKMYQVSVSDNTMLCSEEIFARRELQDSEKKKRNGSK